MKEKRLNCFPVRLNDSEVLALEKLQSSYVSSGVHVTKSDLIRHGLNLIPLQSPFAAFP